MTLDEIKQAVRAGKVVHWSNSGYEVRHWDGHPRDVGLSEVQSWTILCLANHHAIGLTWLDGVTMNGEPEDFYIEEEVPE